MAAEKGLDMLENMCEEQEHKKRIAEEEGKLALYTIQREKEFEKLKGLLCKEIVLKKKIYIYIYIYLYIYIYIYIYINIL